MEIEHVDWSEENDQDIIAKFITEPEGSEITIIAAKAPAIQEDGPVCFSVDGKSVIVVFNEQAIENKIRAIASSDGDFTDQEATAFIMATVLKRGFQAAMEYLEEQNAQ